MTRKSLFAATLALSLTGLAGIAAAGDIQLSPFGKEAQESGLYPTGTPAFHTVAPVQGPALQLVNREASEGLQAMAGDGSEHSLRQTVAASPRWEQSADAAASRGR